jgi:hypothetical protein
MKNLFTNLSLQILRDLLFKINVLIMYLIGLNYLRYLFMMFVV